jgi:CRP-like cAMP-binding protein
VARNGSLADLVVPAPLRGIGRELAFGKGEAVFRKGDPVTAVYLVLHGEVRVYRVARDGSEVALQCARRGDFFAEAAIDATRYRCDAIAMRPTTVEAFAVDAMRKLLAADPLFCAAWAALLARQLHSARTRLERVALRSADARVLHYLQTEGKGPRCEVVITGTLKDVAQELGLTHEALYRTLARLARDRVLGREDGRLYLR